MCTPKAPKIVAPAEVAPPPAPPAQQAQTQANINDIRKPRQPGAQGGSLLTGGTAMGNMPNIGGASLLGQ